MYINSKAASRYTWLMSPKQCSMLHSMAVELWRWRRWFCAKWFLLNSEAAKRPWISLAPALTLSIGNRRISKAFRLIEYKSCFVSLAKLFLRNFSNYLLLSFQQPKSDSSIRFFMASWRPSLPSVCWCSYAPSIRASPNGSCTSHSSEPTQVWIGI